MFFLQGDTIYPHGEPFKPQFENTEQASQFFRSWFSLYSNTPAGLALKSEETIPITPYKWFNNNTLFKIDFSRFSHHSLVGGSYLDPRTPLAQLDIFVDFGVRTPQNIELLLFTSYNEQINIRKSSTQDRDIQIFYSL